MESYNWAVDAYHEGAVFCAFDIETTGLEAKRDRIVELGAVKFDRRGLCARFSVLVNPGIPMPEEAGRVNGITDEMLAGKPPLEEVFPDYLRFVKDTIIIAHNAPFDTGFINEALRVRFEQAAKEGEGGDLLLMMEEGGKAAPWKPPFPVLPNRVADTLVMARAAFPGQGRYNLQDLSAAVGITARDAHRAEDDARLCMELFIKMTAAK